MKVPYPLPIIFFRALASHDKKKKKTKKNREKVNYFSKLNKLHSNKTESRHD